MLAEGEYHQCTHGHRYTVPMWGECPRCQGERNQRAAEVLSEHVRGLRTAMESGHDQMAHRAAQQLRSLGRPDVDGLIRAIKLRLDGVKGGRKFKARAEEQ